MTEFSVLYPLGLGTFILFGGGAGILNSETEIVFATVLFNTGSLRE